MDGSITHQGECWMIRGDVRFANVMDVRKQGDQIIQANDLLVFDFEQVERVDSSALSLLLAWMRQAKLLNKNISFKNIPESLHAIARVCSLQGMLGLETS